MQAHLEPSAAAVMIAGIPIATAASAIARASIMAFPLNWRAPKTSDRHARMMRDVSACAYKRRGKREEGRGGGGVAKAARRKYPGWRYERTPRVGGTDGAGELGITYGINLGAEEDFNVSRWGWQSGTVSGEFLVFVGECRASVSADVGWYDVRVSGAGRAPRGGEGGALPSLPRAHGLLGFSHVPTTKVREVSHMLKAIHAQESRDAADRKARAIVDDLRAARMNTAADLVERSV